MTDSIISQHDLIKAAVHSACTSLGFEAIQEFGGKDWRADVFALRGQERFAFEIQTSPQTLAKTLSRQRKYTRDGVLVCWLFEKPPAKLSEERPDLPLFYVSGTAGGFTVSLSGRRELDLQTFIAQFLRGKVRFSEIAQAQKLQRVKIKFIEMPCWKCGELNHIYSVETVFWSACHALIRPQESLWASDLTEYRPEIIQVVRAHLATEAGKHLRVGEIKPRFSNTVQSEYLSFGCWKCDSIFGDWYVKEAQLNALYDDGYFIETNINLQGNITLPIPHWCYPDEGLPFCDEKREQCGNDG
jgi:hypothetical protein